MKASRTVRLSVATAVAIVVVLLGVSECTGDRATHGDRVPGVASRTLEPGDQAELPWIVATTDIIGDVVSRVGGDAIDLTVLLERGEDPHGFEPTARALAGLAGARIIFVNGFGLEEGLLDVLSEVAGDRMVPVSQGIVPTELSPGDDHASEEDPHTWMSPLNVRTWVRNIQSALTAVDPGSAAVFEQNAEEYLHQLETLDRLVRDTVGQIPADRRKLVTDHRVFAYFARDYGFEQSGFVVASSSTSAEPTPRELAELVQLIREQGVPAIFVGQSGSPRLRQLAQSVAAEIGSEVAVLPVLTGSLAAVGETGDNYLDFIRFNVTQIAKGLGNH